MLLLQVAAAAVHSPDGIPHGVHWGDVLNRQHSSARHACGAIARLWLSAASP